MKMSEITELFNGFAPEYLAESWDNPGLLVGDENAEIKKRRLRKNIRPLQKRTSQ